MNVLPDSSNLLPNTSMQISTLCGEPSPVYVSAEKFRKPLSVPYGAYFPPFITSSQKSGCPIGHSKIHWTAIRISSSLSSSEPADSFMIFLEITGSFRLSIASTVSNMNASIGICRDRYVRSSSILMVSGLSKKSWIHSIWMKCCSCKLSEDCWMNPSL